MEEHGFLRIHKKTSCGIAINISVRLLIHADFFTTPDANSHSMPAPIVSKEIDGGVNDWGTFKAIRLE